MSTKAATLFVLISFLFVLPSTYQEVEAQNVPRVCESITFLSGQSGETAIADTEFTIDRDSVIRPGVRVKVVVNGPTNRDLVCNSGTNCQHIIEYKNRDLPGARTKVADLAFDSVIPNNSTGTSIAIASLVIDTPGTWTYSLKLSNGGSILGNSGISGCATQENETKTFTIEVTPSDLGVPIRGRCADLFAWSAVSYEEIDSYFTCSVYAASAGTAENDIEVGCSSSDQQFAREKCESGRTVFGEQLRFVGGPTNYCIPCSIGNKSITSVGFLERCTDPATLITAQGDLSVCEGSLICRQVSGQHRCVYPFREGSRSENETCHLEGTDCNEQQELACYPSDGSQPGIGVCLPKTNFECSSDNSQGPCAAAGPGAVCVGQRCVPACDPSNPNRDRNGCSVTSNTSNPNEIIEVDPSTAFGIRNCPGASILTGSDGEPLLDSQGRVRAGYDTTSGVSRQEFNDCVSCIRFGGTWTAIGCIGTTPQALIGSLTRIGLGVMGGIALLRLIYLGFIYQTGDEGKIKEAREGVVSTLGAVVLVLFSVLILQIIGVNVLDIVPEGFFIPQ